MKMVGTLLERQPLFLEQNLKPLYRKDKVLLKLILREKIGMTQVNQKVLYYIRRLMIYITLTVVSIRRLAL